MPTTLLSENHDCTSPCYLLGFNQDDINTITDDADSLDDDGILDKSSNEEEEQQQKTQSTADRAVFFMDKFNPPAEGTPPPEEGTSSGTIADEISLLHDTKTVKREKQILHIIPESRSNGILFSNGTIQSFTCEINCSQHISYNVISTLKYRQFDLGKLDIVLNENSVLDIQMDCTLNGLDILGHPAWLTDALSKIMKTAGFANITLQQQQQEKENRCVQFGVQKAFVTTPLSYLLEKQAPHGVLDTIRLHLDWQLFGNSKQFLSNWKDGYEKQVFVDYVKEALFEMLMRRVFHYYPLIFSNFQVKRLAPVISQLPHISHSLYKIMQTAKDTSPNRDFTKKLAEKVKMIEANTMIMRPHYSGVSENMVNENDDKNSITTSLTLGMYNTLINNAKQQQRKNDPLGKLAALSIRDSPDALEAIGKIWSITCSSAASTLTE